MCPPVPHFHRILFSCLDRLGEKSNQTKVVACKYLNKVRFSMRMSRALRVMQSWSNTKGYGDTKTRCDNVTAQLI